MFNDDILLMFIHNNKLFFNRITQGIQSEKFLYLNSAFFAELELNGVDAVSKHTRGTARNSTKDINVFEKKFIFIVINQSLHWSLAVVVNPGQMVKNKHIENGDKMDNASFLLHFDSCGSHNGKDISQLLYSWLQREANDRFEKGGKITINTRVLPLCCPKGMYTACICALSSTHDMLNIIHLQQSNALSSTHDMLTIIHLQHYTYHITTVPQQTNGFDCGIFVCLFVHAMLQLCNESYNTNTKSDFMLKKSREIAVKKWITCNPAFKFEQADATKMRSQMPLLIERLARIQSDNKNNDRKSSDDNNCNIWSKMTKDELIAECEKNDIPANHRFAKGTLITKLSNGNK